MTDRPIIFSAPMVRALLDGRKTQTRRLITPGTCTVLGTRVTAKNPAWTGLDFNKAAARTLGPLGTPRPHLSVPWDHPDDPTHGGDDSAYYRVDPIIQADDRLYVREWWAPLNKRRCCRIGDATFALMVDGHQQYKDGKSIPGLKEYAKGAFDTVKWAPSIHMPRWASRLTLVVTDVRVERLQEISEADALAEGIEPSGKFPDRSLTPAGDYAVPVVAFQRLWESINGPKAWDANPWVAAVSFTVHRTNIDALLSEVAA